MRPSVEFLDRLKSSIKREDLYYLISTITSTALGKSETWLPEILNHAFNSRITKKKDQDEKEDRLKIFKEIKEALIKSSILIGIPKVIESSMTLKKSGHLFDINEKTFLKSDFIDLSVQAILKEGDQGLDRVYRDDIEEIFNLFGEENQDLTFLSRLVTYGIFLGPIQPNSPLTIQQTEVIILSALIPQRMGREVLWHLRGCIRNGLKRDEVESIQSAIESVCRECGMDDPGNGMPSVNDVKLQIDEAFRDEESSK